jgi:hypothetical protein
MSKTERISARASVATKEKLLKLTERYGSQSEVLAVAIDRLYVQEFGETSEKLKGGEAKN